MSALSLALRQSACQSERNGSDQRATRMQPQGAARTCRTSTRDSPSWIEKKLLVPSPYPSALTSALSKDCCCS
eukprot:scaffold79499_cov42-Phaeocystis_antarctica.AAC.1